MAEIETTDEPKIDEPNLKITCLRCEETAPLIVKSARKEGNQWRPTSSQRPLNCIPGPANLGDTEKGLCPDCAKKWDGVQNNFLASTDEERPGLLVTRPGAGPPLMSAAGYPL